MQRHKRIPFLSRAEKSLILDCCERTPDGCLLYTSDKDRAHHITLRGELYSITRVAWAEAFEFSATAREQLETHEVIHIPECPHPYHYRGKDPVCIEPTHLILGDHVDVMRARRVRDSVNMCAFCQVGGAKTTCGHCDKLFHRACLSQHVRVNNLAPALVAA